MKWFLGIYSVFYTVLFALFSFSFFNDINDLDPISLIVRLTGFACCLVMGVFMWIEFFKYKNNDMCK